MLGSYRIGTRLALLVISLLVPLVVLVILGHVGMNKINTSLKTVYEDRTVCLVQLSDIQLNISHIRIRFLGFIATGATGDRKALAKDIHGYVDNVEKVWKEYKATYLTPEEQGIAGEFETAWTGYRGAIEEVLNRVMADDAAGAVDYSVRTATPIFRALETALTTDITLQDRVAKEEYAKGQNTFETTATVNLIAALVGAVTALGLAWVIVRGIIGPVAGMVAAMTALADGNNAVEVPASDRRDEIGDMAKAVEVFKRNALERETLERQKQEAAEHRQIRQNRMESLTGEFDQAVADLLKGVGAAALHMQETASALTSNAELTQRQSAAVAAATEEASTNVNIIAAASNELLASVREIGSQVTRSANISAKAAEEARRTNERISGLAAAATRVGEVVNLINGIANKTNLLALNATIEAARAGEAGKGFAVVANEVKHLANQTARATEEIASQIGAIQSETGDTVTAMRRITDVIGEINEMSSAIAGAVEEQGAAMQEVVRNVEQAAAGTSEVARSIVQVAEAADGTGHMAAGAKSAATALLNQNDGLRRSVEGFLSSIKAA